MSAIKPSAAATTPARGPIVLPSDTAYAPYLATTLRSIVDANRHAWPLDLHILADGLAAATKGRVAASLPAGSAQLRWIDVDLDFFAPYAQRFSRTAYARLLIPSVFPDYAGKLLYLDSDLLVLANLDPLWSIDLEGAVIGAVLDGLDRDLKVNDPRYVAVPRVRNYFNAGVLLIDLDRWRAERITERAIDYMTRNPNAPFYDQDALNFACDGRWKPLDEHWNFHYLHFNHRFARMPAAARPAIVHFVDVVKPWKPASLSPNAGFYDGFRRRTRFARTPFEVLRDALQTLWFRFRRRRDRTAI